MKRLGSLLTLLCLVACGSTQQRTHLVFSSPERLNTAAYDLAEGPAWDGADSLYFTEIFASRLHRYSFKDHTFEVVLEHAHAANGTAIDAHGQLWICEQDTGSIVTFNPETRSKHTVAHGYAGVPLNHPNDLTLDSHGGAYFTDPAWDESVHRKQPVNGIYYLNKQGDVSLLLDDFDKPNGILLDQNEQYLYIVDMGTDSFKRYPVVAPGVLGEGNDFARLVRDNNQLAAPDGLDEDNEGNIYVATHSGVQIFTAQGQFVTRISLPQRPTNLEFTASDSSQLVITTTNHLYRVTRLAP